jgi:hypothetical protein
MMAASTKELTIQGWSLGLARIMGRSMVELGKSLMLLDAEWISGRRPHSLLTMVNTSVSTHPALHVFSGDIPSFLPEIVSAG